ncbi:hypothetical protein QYM36_005489 [Artemia franciscana]|uniref:Origin recognition complex subunit 2 n=1 Tax=Artemia franciscana TaxID=6661 RepID=A0AA88I4Q8_ARTSF|nr:hypothetical protein QYM36_005489 [Artemia franciscana]
MRDQEWGKGKLKKSVQRENGEREPEGLSEEKANVPATPDRRRRQKLKQRIQKITEDILEDLSSSSGSEFEPSSSESSDDEDEDKNLLHSFKNVKKNKPFQRTPGKPRKNRPMVDAGIDVESYFKSQSEDNLTSNRTLNRLSQPRLEKAQVDNILKNLKNRHEVEYKELVDEHRSLFPKWLFLLMENYNILLYGFGSKSALIEEFHLALLPDEDVLVITGFFPSLTVKEVLNSITFDILEMKESFSSIESQLIAIERQLKVLKKHVYLLINNIDGVAFQNEKSQVTLSNLAAIEGVKIVASIDHLNSPLCTYYLNILVEFSFM